MLGGEAVFADHGFRAVDKFRPPGDEYRGDVRVRMLPCTQQFWAMAFAQITYRESCAVLRPGLARSPQNYTVRVFAGRGQVYLGRCERAARLASLARRHRPVDWPRAQAVRGQRYWARS